ncbi:MAG: methyl-accepting chemotaxis protein [Roseibium sp.]
MFRLSNLRISTRQLIGFGAILSMLVLLTGVAAFQVHRINENLTTMIDVNSVKQRYAINFRGSVHDRAIALRDVTLVQSDEDLSNVLKEIDRLAEFYIASAGPMDEIFATSGDVTQTERDLLQAIKDIEAETLPVIERVIALKQSDAAFFEAQGVLLSSAAPKFVEWLARINAFIDHQEQANRAIAAQTRAISQGFVTLAVGMCAASLLIGAAFAYWNYRSVKPLNSATRVMRKLADGDLSAEVPESRTQDEVGNILSALRVFKETMVKTEELSARQLSENEERARRARKMEELTRSFDEKVSNLLANVTNSATEMENTSRSMSGIAGETSDRAVTVSGAAERASENVQTVASATEELSSSVQEIGAKMSHASDIAKRAVDEAGQTDRQIQGLAEAAQKIGDVVSLISAIAEQTNLLALNATIEAARAGEAGKGFAVVASEVKELATQTAKATEEIGNQITGIQSETGAAVSAIQSIGSTINDINDIAAAISEALESQGRATSEIAQSVEQASIGTQDVSSNIAEVTQIAERTGSSANQVTGVAQDLRQKADELKREVETFLHAVKAA